MGTFYGVGVGPGDPELLTCKAVRVLSAVDLIFLPAGQRSGNSFVRRILEPLDLPESKFRLVALNMTRERQEDQQTYQQVAQRIGEEVRQGKSVAWITEGDPLLYSTFIYVYAKLRELCPEIPVEIIPGITSLQAAAAVSGLPIARLHDCVAVVPAVYGLERLPALMNEFATVFLVKVHSVFDRLLEQLERMTSPPQAFYLEQVGTSSQRIITNLSSLRGQELPYFSLVILRRVE